MTANHTKHANIFSVRDSSRRLLRDGGPQIFFQTGEGAFKGGVVLPVGLIEQHRTSNIEHRTLNVWRFQAIRCWMFNVQRSMFCSQFFASLSRHNAVKTDVRVQALPFFQRRVIRQRDGKKFAPLFRAPTGRELRSHGGNSPTASGCRRRSGRNQFLDLPLNRA